MRGVCGNSIFFNLAVNTRPRPTVENITRFSRLDKFIIFSVGIFNRATVRASYVVINYQTEAVAYPNGFQDQILGIVVNPFFKNKRVTFTLYFPSAKLFSVLLRSRQITYRFAVFNFFWLK